MSFMGLACILCSCRSLAGGDGYRQPKSFYVTDGQAIPLFDTALLGGSLELAQHVKGSYGGKTYFMDVYVKADTAGLDMVGLNSMGTQILDLSYSKTKGIRVSGAFGMARLGPEYVVADFQLAYYPYEALRDALARRGFAFDLEDRGGFETRILSRGGKAILTVEALADGRRLSNALRGYSYEIREER